MRTKFISGAVEYNIITAVIVVAMANRGMGMVVDYISEVIKMHNRRVMPVPESGMLVNAKYLAGLVMVGQKTVGLLNIEQLMSMVYERVT